jgi:hypothetical protein
MEDVLSQAGNNVSIHPAGNTFNIRSCSQNFETVTNWDINIKKGENYLKTS